MEEFFAETKSALWQWLMDNHRSSSGVWLVHYKKSSGKGDMTYSDIVDYCLCFGWIDGVKGKVDEEKTKFRITPRNGKSGWSKINRDKVTVLTKAGMMQEMGVKAVMIAKENGSWEKLIPIEQMLLPDDLEKLLQAKKLLPRWHEKSKTQKQMWLYHLLELKKPESRQRYMEKIIEGLG